MEDSDISSFIKTKNGLMPKWYYSNYMYKKSTKKLSNKWPTKEFIDSLNLDIVNKIINVDK